MLNHQIALVSFCIIGTGQARLEISARCTFAGIESEMTDSLWQSPSADTISPFMLSKHFYVNGTSPPIILGVSGFHILIFINFTENCCIL